jgi:hypothetical protein
MVHTYNNGVILEEMYSPSQNETTTRLVYRNGAIYTGGHFNDIRQGNGTMIWLDGTVYVGEFDNDKPVGKGCYHNSMSEHRTYQYVDWKGKEYTETNIQESHFLDSSEQAKVKNYADFF